MVKLVMDTQIGDLPLWVPLALGALLPILYLASRLALGVVVWIVTTVRRIRRHTQPEKRSRGWALLSRPSAFLLTVAVHRALALRIGISARHRTDYDLVSLLLLLVGVLWWLWRLVDLGAERTRARLMPTHPRTAQSVYVLGRRVLKGAAVGLALLIALAAVGVNLSATLAGLGIGGIALAFAAQKTLENVFGGIFVLSDRSVVVGDFCRIGEYAGEVEDVGLRTMQLRTLNRTIVHVPNGTLATMEVENFSRRDKYLYNPTVGLRYETTPEQMEQVLSATRAVLAADKRIEQATARVSFVRFGVASLDVEVFAYVLVRDYASFLPVQEELLLRIMGIAAETGTVLACPSQTMYVRQHSGEALRVETGAEPSRAS